MANLGIRYATALFDISQESGLINEYYEQAQFVRDQIQSVDVQQVLRHPRISSDEKFAFLQSAFGEHIHQDFMGFMRLAVYKNREAFILPAINRLVDMIKTYKRQTTAKVVSAVPLTDTQIAEIAGLLMKKFNKRVDITVSVDPSVIAGISIHVDGWFFDRTVKTMLKDLKSNLSAENNKGE